MFTSGIMPICNFGVYDTKIRRLVSVFWSGTQISVLDFVVLKFDDLKTGFRCFEISTFWYPIRKLRTGSWLEKPFSIQSLKVF